MIPGMNELLKYFPDLTDNQVYLFEQLGILYPEWNAKINVISRKDIDMLYLHHILHSLSIAKLIRFCAGTNVIDAGTGGGFPGIPLAVVFPEVLFSLVDATEKKIKVVKAIAENLGLKNIRTEHNRLELVTRKTDFVVSRAVTAFPDFVQLVKKNIIKGGNNPFKNGIIYLKGGEFNEEIKPFHGNISVHNISDFFSEEFFLTKKIIYLPC